MFKSPKSLSTNALIGRNIKSWDGRNLGRIAELIIDPVTRRIVYAIVSPDSASTSLATVPWDALAVSQSDGSFYVQDETRDADSQPTRVMVYTTQICRSDSL